MTIHKCQGCEYEAVVIVTALEHWSMLRRCLLYTGVTRARQVVYVVGNRTAFEYAVKTPGIQQRWSMLPKFLTGGTNEL